MIQIATIFIKCLTGRYCVKNKNINKWLITWNQRSVPRAMRRRRASLKVRGPTSIGTPLVLSSTKPVNPSGRPRCFSAALLKSNVLILSERPNSWESREEIVKSQCHSVFTVSGRHKWDFVQNLCLHPAAQDGEIRFRRGELENERVQPRLASRNLRQ